MEIAGRQRREKVETTQKFDVTGMVSDGHGMTYHRIPESTKDAAWKRFKAANSKYDCVMIEVVKVG